MKLEYCGKEPMRFVGGIKITEVKKGDVIEVANSRAKAWLDAHPKRWKKHKEKTKPNEEGKA